MTRLCAPVKAFPFFPDKVDLYEVDRGSYKALYDREGKLCYIDMDWKNFPPSFATVPVIVSYHNFEETPELEAVLRKLEERHPRAHFYKIVTLAKSTLDSLRLLSFLKKFQEKQKIIGFCMGEFGVITRICAPIFEVPIMYAPLKKEDKNAPGQLLVDELEHIYHFSALNPSTSIFGLIGGAVSKSCGHLFHNDRSTSLGLNAVYVKMVVKAEELAQFFFYLTQLPFRGISITTPLKQEVVSFLNGGSRSALKAGSVNTLIIKEGKCWGYNTDGRAAFSLVGAVKGKTVVVLGAGGVSRSVVQVALQRGARVIVVNRTLQKGKDLSIELGCEWREEIPSYYDILVNTTSSTMPIFGEQLSPNKKIIDFSIEKGGFLEEAERRGCFCVDGISIYVKQAVMQQRLWNRDFRFVKKEFFPFSLGNDNGT